MLAKRILLAAGLLAGVLLAASGAAQPPPLALVPYARVSHEPLTEISGIVKSRRYPGVYWVHNDSGDVPRLFAVRAADGSALLPPWMAGEYYVGGKVEGKKEYPGVQIDLAANFDWEDIAIDGDTLYIADTGNNGNARRDLGVYVLTEPNPLATGRSRVLKWLPVAYPDQTEFPGQTRWNFDCEAVFALKGKLYFLTKHRAGGKIDTPATGSNLYRLDTAHTDQVNLLTKVDSHPDLGGWVTAADVSPDGKTLAVLCQWPVQSVWLFEAKSGDRFLSGSARRLVFTGAKQCEAICFDGADSLIVTNEQRDLFRLSLRDFTPAAAAR